MSRRRFNSGLLVDTLPLRHESPIAPKPTEGQMRGRDRLGRQEDNLFSQVSASTPSSFEEPDDASNSRNSEN